MVNMHTSICKDKTNKPETYIYSTALLAVVVVHTFGAQTLLLPLCSQVGQQVFDSRHMCLTHTHLHNYTHTHTIMHETSACEYVHFFAHEQFTPTMRRDARQPTNDTTNFTRTTALYENFSAFATNFALSSVKAYRMAEEWK